MKKYLLLSVLVSSLTFGQELIQIPAMPTAAALNKAVNPPKADCESCKENQKTPLQNVSPQLLKQVESIKASSQCQTGKKRLKNDVSFYLNGGSISKTTIGGNWQPGLLSNGAITDLYVGVSAYKDLMFVTKVTDNGNLIGYNVTISLCEVPNAYPNYPALVSNERALANFQAPYGLILDTSTNCGHGVIVAATNTVIISKKKTSDVNTTDFPVYTSFTKPNCGGEF